MRYEIKDNAVHVVLSKRNLLTLLAKVDDPASAGTLVKQDGELDNPILLVVSCESDETHYNERTDGPAGRVHPVAEEFIKANS